MRTAILGGVLLLGMAVVVTSSVATAAEPTKATPQKTPEKLQSATGTIMQINAASRAFVVSVAGGSQTHFSWTPQTRINGTLSQGAKVTVRFTTLSDGQNVARQISVGR